LGHLELVFPLPTPLVNFHFSPKLFHFSQKETICCPFRLP